MGTYLFAGASSKIAIETAKLLKKEGHKVIGISTKLASANYDEFYTVSRYNFISLPKP